MKLRADFTASECPSAGQQKARARSQDLQEQEEHRDAVQGGEAPAPRVPWREGVDTAVRAAPRAPSQGAHDHGATLQKHADEAGRGGSFPTSVEYEACWSQDERDSVEQLRSAEE